MKFHCYSNSALDIWNIDKRLLSMESHPRTKHTPGGQDWAGQHPYRNFCEHDKEGCHDCIAHLTERCPPPSPLWTHSGCTATWHQPSSQPSAISHNKLLLVSTCRLCKPLSPISVTSHGQTHFSWSDLESNFQHIEACNHYWNPTFVNKAF